LHQPEDARTRATSGKTFGVDSVNTPPTKAERPPLPSLPDPVLTQSTPTRSRAFASVRGCLGPGQQAVKRLVLTQSTHEEVRRTQDQIGSCAKKNGGIATINFGSMNKTDSEITPKTSHAGYASKGFKTFSISLNREESRPLSEISITPRF
jgi:hypothetical protein